MTRRQKIRLGVTMHFLDTAIRDLEKAKAKGDAEVANLPGCEAYGGDMAVRLGVYGATIEHNAKHLRSLFEQIREIFPSVKDPLA